MLLKSFKMGLACVGLMSGFGLLAQQTMPIPNHESEYQGNARGFWFTAPEDFTITGLKVPDDWSQNPQSIELLRFLNGEPPLYSTTTNDFDSLFRVVDDTSTEAIPVSIQVLSGDVIGVFGVRSDANSYAASPFVSQIGSTDVTLTRLGMQLPLTTNVAQNVWQETGLSISRVEITYVLGIQYSIGGEVANLNGTLELQNNLGDNLIIDTDGPFQFETLLSPGSNYDVTVLSHPDSQLCTVNLGTGTNISANVSDIEVVCEDIYFVGGTVIGLIPDNYLVLQNNKANDLIMTEEDTFVFSTALSDMDAYEVTIETQPNDPIQLCTVSNETGNIAGADVLDIVVDCEFGIDLIYRHGFDTPEAIQPPDL
jgi:hypothetical protein